MDWVPAQGYGGTTTIVAEQTRNIPLLDPESRQGAEVEGRYEDDDSLFIHRIVGQYIIYWDDTPQFAQTVVPVRIGPAQVRTISTVVNFPWAVNNSTFAWEDDGPAANFRFWFERRHQLDVPAVSMLGHIDHPWWSNIDIRPKQKLTLDEVPAFSVRNTHPDPGRSVVFRYWLRLLVSSTR